MSSSSAERATTESPAAEPSLFVINLCASTTPMALVHPSNPELKRYTFFVTRQREEGRERFRLHMGYFASLFEAETLLGAVRDVYPAAWAGPAPTSGAPRRGRVVSNPAPAEAAPAPVQAPEPVAEPAVVQAAPAPSAPPVTVQAAVAAVVAPEPAVVPESAVQTSVPTLDAMSNVRDVLAQLSDDAPTRMMPAPSSIPTLSESQTLRVLEVGVSAPVAAAPAPTAPVAKPAARPEVKLETTSIERPTRKPEVKLETTPVEKPTYKPEVKLETRPVEKPVEKPAAEAKPVAKVRKQAPQRSEADEVRIVTPEDTQTLRDIRLDAERNAPPCFAVQLLWSVTPINITDHPHLAIFDAYTLYNVEGNRQGRRWFGLRLGFFTDPNAATQVAYYVRSDYPTVAVVPVAEKERDRARGHDAVAIAPAPAPVRKLQDDAALLNENLDGFQLLEDDRPPPPKRDVDDAAATVPTVQAAKKPAPKPVVKAPGKPTGKRVVVRHNGKGRVTPGAATPLEQTLEILGASTLTIDESREVINDSAIRSPVVPKKKAGRLSKLLNRLGGG